MTSRFVSTGAIDATTGDAVPIPVPAPTTTTTDAKKSAEWAAVQAQLESERQAREAKRRAEREGEKGTSLFEVLEANKAAKQAAFEEANKIKNQFRALDEDEIGFLEEVALRKREEEEMVRRETEEGLKGFAEARKREAENVELGEAEGEGMDGGGWKVGGKRKRRKGEGEGGGLGLLKGVKRRTGDGADRKAEKEEGVDTDESKGKRRGEAVEKAEATEKAELSAAKDSAAVPAVKQPPPSAATQKAKPTLGLVDYGSDDDSE